MQRSDWQAFYDYKSGKLYAHADYINYFVNNTNNNVYYEKLLKSIKSSYVNTYQKPMRYIIRTYNYICKHKEVY